MSDDTRIDTADVLAIDAKVARATGSDQFGITKAGFVAKPFARLLAEKLALARELLGDELDLSSGSAVRKLLEVSALEDARTWAALSSMYDNSFVVSATGDALSRLGEELGIPRPNLEAQGHIQLQAELLPDPDDEPELLIPRGARLLTAGGHHVATDETVVLSSASPVREVAVVAFYRGPEHNLNPSFATQKIDRWNYADVKLTHLHDLTEDGQARVNIVHDEALSGGQLRWADARYRDLLLRAPRSLWTVDAIRFAVSLVPGVRQVQVFDDWGGLDITQSIFGEFLFGQRVFKGERTVDLIERVFRAESSLAYPYDFAVLVAPTEAAIWAGPDGLRASVESAIEDLRPIGIFPQIRKADEVSVGIAADLVVEGLPLPTGSGAVVNDSVPAIDLKQRLLQRVRNYLHDLQFGETVRWSEVMWALMSEPGIADVKNLCLLRYPPGFASVDFAETPPPTLVEEFGCEQNIELKKNQIAVFVDDDSRLTIV